MYSLLDVLINVRVQRFCCEPKKIISFCRLCTLYAIISLGSNMKILRVRLSRRGLNSLWIRANLQNSQSVLVGRYVIFAQLVLKWNVRVRFLSLIKMLTVCYWLCDPNSSCQPKTCLHKYVLVISGSLSQRCRKSNFKEFI